MANPPEDIRRIWQDAKEKARDYVHDPKAMIELARLEGLNDEEIVLRMTQNKSAATVHAFAEKFAKHLGMTVAQFKRVAGPRSVKR
jgi:hypothetical protein